MREPSLHLYFSLVIFVCLNLSYEHFSFQYPVDASLEKCKIKNCMSHLTCIFRSYSLQLYFGRSLDFKHCLLARAVSKMIGLMWGKIF